MSIVRPSGEENGADLAGTNGSLSVRLGNHKRNQHINIWAMSNWTMFLEEISSASIQPLHSLHLVIERRQFLPCLDANERGYLHPSLSAAPTAGGGGWAPFSLPIGPKVLVFHLCLVVQVVRLVLCQIRCYLLHPSSPHRLGGCT